MTTNDDLMARARATFPGGVNSPVRAYGSVGGTPRMLVRGHGAWVVDADGNELLDLVGGWGPALLGHAHPAVVRAVTDAASRGLGFGAPSPVETVLAEHIRDRVPPAERVRLVSTGTEATMTAVRLARGATGRDLIVKFAGHYHGHSDGLLAAAGSGPTTLGLPDSAGVPHPVASLTIVLPYHDLDALQQAFAAHGDRIAAIITEAAPANMGVIRPEPGLNAALAAIAHAHGALLISDEVLTGFRASRAGWWGVERAAGNGATPDLLTFGKVIGGGLPVAAVAGRADILDLLAPQGPVYQAGTLSGNPVAVAAGVATLEAADDDAYRRCDAATTEAIAAVTTALTAASVPHHIARAGTLFSVAFGLDRAPQNYDAVRRQEAWRYPPFFHAMLAHGVSLPPSVFEAWFVSAAHDERALDRLVTALPHAARAAAATPPPT